MKELKRTLNKLFEKAKEFIKKIKPEEKVLLMYHSDTDGICSAVLMILGLKKLGIKIKKSVYVNTPLTIPKNGMKFDKIIILDVPIGTTECLPKKKILVFDHHPSQDINSKNIVFVNPRLGNKKIYQPVSYLVYRFFSQFIDMKKYEWIAVLGTIADFGYEDCKDLTKKYISRKPKNLKKTKLGKLSDRFNSYINYAGVKEALRLLLSLNSLRELKKNKKVEHAHFKFEKKLKKVKENFLENAEFYKKLIFGIIKTKERRIGSSLSSVLSIENKNKVIIIAVNKGKFYNVHARNHWGKFDLGKLMKKCCDLEGGGHPRAGGGKVRDLEKFKKCILREIKNISKERNKI